VGNKWTIRTVSLAAVLGAAMALAPPLRAEIADCREIAALPATITNRGVYCLLHNLATAAASGIAITINADDVIIDLNGHKLEGTAGLATLAIGIGSVDHSNIAIRNGTIRGFVTGIQLTDFTDVAFGNLVEDIKADRNTNTGIFVGGRGSIVRKNQVLATGGSTAPGYDRPTGIAVNAPGGLVSGNLVQGTFSGTDDFWNIHATRSDGATIEGNQIENKTLSATYDFGIIIPFSHNVLVVNNRFANTHEAVTYSSGGTGKFRDNLTSGVTTPYPAAAGVIDAGNNN
jgi:hypothetical protein